MRLWWGIFGGVGVTAALVIAWIQLDSRRRAARLDFDPARYGEEQLHPRMLRGQLDALCVYTQWIAMRWVGLPLAAAHAALFATVGLVARPAGYLVGSAAAVVLMPVRRLLNLRAFATIVRTVWWERGPVTDRDGQVVAAQSYWELVRSWYRHEYTGRDLADMLFLKSVGIVLHIACWPLTLLATQVSHVMFCQEPWHALGHETDGGSHPGEALRRFGEATPPDVSRADS